MLPHPAAALLFLGCPSLVSTASPVPDQKLFWGCPLELGEGLGGWSLFLQTREGGPGKAFVSRRAPHGPAQFQCYGLSMWSWTSALEIEKDPQYRHPWIMLLNTCLHMLLMGNSLNGLYNLSSKPGHFELWKEVQLIVLQDNRQKLELSWVQWDSWSPQVYVKCPWIYHCFVTWSGNIRSVYAKRVLFPLETHSLGYAIRTPQFHKLESWAKKKDRKY